MALKITNVQDLSGWQVPIAFNGSELKFLAANAGDFFQVEQPFPRLLNGTEQENLLLLGSALPGTPAGKSGNGTLALIIFGYYTNSYKLPEIAKNASFEALLLNSAGISISLDGPTRVTLEPAS
jgi:hypothetical protein